MGNGNTLMFEVAVSDSVKQLDKIKQELDKFSTDYASKLKLKVEIDNLNSLTQALSQIGDNQNLRNLRAEITELNRQFLQLSKGAGGVGDINARGLSQSAEKAKQEWDDAVKNLERYRKQYDDLKVQRSSAPNATVAASYDKQMSEMQLKMDGATSKADRLRASYEQLAKEAANANQTAAKSTKEWEAEISKLKAQIDSLRANPVNVNIGGEFKTWAEQVQTLVAQVKELVAEFQKLRQVQGQSNAASSVKSQANEVKQEVSQFTELDRVIRGLEIEVGKLVSAFSKLSSADGLTNLQLHFDAINTAISQLATTLSTLSNAIKLQPIDEQVKALLERAETAEKKLKEVGDAARYLNERAGERTQQKASNIANIAGAKEELELDEADAQAKTAKITHQQRYNNILADTEKLLNRIGNAMNNGGDFGVLNAAFARVNDFAERMRMVDKNDATAVSNISSEYARLAQVFGKITAEQEKFINAKEKAADRQAKADAKVVADTEKALNREYAARKKATESIRKQAEAAVEARQKMLRSQSDSLSKILSGGKEKLDTYQYEQVRDALRAIREEMRQIEAARQRGGLSTGALLSLAGGTNDFSAIISAYQKFISSKQTAAASTSQLTAEEQRLAQAIGRSTQEMHGQSQVMSDLKTMATQYLGVWGAQGFLKNVIEIGGQLEMQRLSIGAILGDMAKANELFDRIKSLAVKSPFGVVELDQMTKQLSAYGFEYNELFDMTKRLADISAATGTSVDRLALALGHVRSEAALSGYTLRQFSMANIPLAKKLSEELTKVEGKFVSVADVRKRVRTKDIGYEQVLKVLKDLTDEGGMFYNAQEVMSESVKARFKNLKDSMDIMYGEIAESSVGGALKDVAALLTTLTRHWQELGAVLVTGAGYWAINKFAMLAANKTMIQYNLTSGQFTAKQLEMQATTGNLTRAQLLQAVATKRLAVADAEAAAAALGLSRAQLLHVASTGKVASAMNMATIATSKYTISQLRMLAAMRSMNLGWLGTGLLTVANGFKVATAAAWGFMKAMWPMLAISAIAEVFMSLKRESDQFAESANYVGQSARQMMKDIDDALKTVSSNGKPVDTEALREAVNTMKEVVQQSEFYTAEQQNQVDKAETLSKKYDVLLKQMKEIREEAEWQTSNESLIQKILSNTGKEVITGAVTSEGVRRDFGVPFFNDNIMENMDQVNSANSQLDSAVSMLAEYQNVMAKAIEENKNFGLSLDGKSWQEQIKIIAESGYWDEFVGSVKNAGSRFKDAADKVKDASDDVSDKWNEVINDDFKAIMVTMEHELKTNEDGVKSWAQTNQNTVKFMADGIAKALKLSEKNIEKFMKFFYSLFGLEYKGKAQQKEPTQYDLQSDLSKQVLGNVIRHNKNNGQGGNGVATVKEINDIVGTGEHVKTPSEVVKAIKERAQKDLQTMNDIKKIYGETSDEYKKAKKAYDKSLNIAESNGIPEDEIKTGKYKDKKEKKTPDEAAKAVREEIRIMKEAADAFQYWRNAVGDDAAWSHVEAEFGDVLKRIGITAKNVNDLRGNIVGLTPKIERIKDKKVKDETFKEQSKELAQLNRKNFEKFRDEYSSKVQNELDNLTRAWEIFNNVRNATGNIDLAVQISGDDYANGQTRNLADALRQKIEKDFAKAGVQTIAFNMSFDDRTIKKEIEQAFAQNRPQQQSGESDEAYATRLQNYEMRIKGIVEEYKKWRDLQRDVLKGDIDVFNSIIGSAVDYESQLRKINSDYEKRKASLDAGLANGTIKQDAYAQAMGMLDVETETKRWQASQSYIDLMNNSLAMTKDEIEAAAHTQEDSLNKQLEAGLITIKQYSDEMAKLRGITSDYKLETTGRYSNRFTAFMTGGGEGLQEYYRRRANQYRTAYNNATYKDSPEAQEALKQAQHYDDLSEKQKKAADTAQDMTDSLGKMKGAVDMLTQFLEAAGGGDETLSGFGDMLGGAMNGASAGAAFGPYGAAIGGALGAVTSIMQMSDKEAQKTIEALKENSKAIEANTAMIETNRERTLGYDTGDLRRRLLQLEKNRWNNGDYKIDTGLFEITDPVGEAMQDFYSRNASKTGYQQQLEDLNEQKRIYQNLYTTEESKKNASGEALTEYKQKIAELEDEIIFFTEDLAKELWGIDFKSWADQISDALWTAFENGEDAVKAFRDTANDIIADVAKKMMNIHFIEPAFKELETQLFGGVDSNGNVVKGAAYNEDTGTWNEDETLRILGKFFGEDGEFAKVINNSEAFYKMAERVAGVDFSSNGESSMSGTIKGITEQTADLLASYVNAIRADVSVNRQMIAQYFPMYYDVLTNGSTSLRNIENHTAAIMRSNDAIERSNQAILDNFNGLKNKSWKMPVA